MCSLKNRKYTFNIRIFSDWFSENSDKEAWNLRLFVCMCFVWLCIHMFVRVNVRVIHFQPPIEPNRTKTNSTQILYTRSVSSTFDRFSRRSAIICDKNRNNCLKISQNKTFYRLYSSPILDLKEKATVTWHEIG